MSLYIGNLSEHIRKDELERVFRRFGRCNVQLKREGYGFVVFDFPSDAEKTLKALKGRNICGEPLTLTWSNKQPTGNFQRFDRDGGRSYGLRRARNSDRLGFARRKVGFNEWKNNEIGNAGRGESVDVPGEKRGFRHDDFEECVREEKDYGGDFHDDGGGGVAPDQVDNGGLGEGGLGEPIHDPANGGGTENAIEFDRYKPYHGYDRKDDGETHHVGYSGSSPAKENTARAQIGEENSNRLNDSKFQQTCYRCGDSGHKMRNCPKEHSERRKYNRLDVEQNNKIDRKRRVEAENGFGSGPWVKLRSTGDSLSMRDRRDERRVSGSRHYHAPLRNIPPSLTKEADRHRRKEYRGKKRSRNEIESPNRSREKISKRSISSSLPSDHTLSRSLSNSHASKSRPRSSSRSRSRSVSSRAHSSSSKSPYRRGECLNSRSSSPNSLSEPLNKPLPSSPNKIQLNSKSSSVNATALVSADHLVGQGQQAGSAMEMENLQSNDTCIAVNGNVAVYTAVVDAVEKDQYVQEGNNGNCILSNTSDGVTYLTNPLVSGNSLSELVKETEGFRNSEASLVDIPTDIQKPASDSHINPHSGVSTTISTEEMYMVLKNYDLELPKDDEKNLTVDAFFGSARLWPWPIVYYRRLKKGPISTENYARRVAQNQEFGIVDKYIRSSSGWGEISLENS